MSEKCGCTSKCPYPSPSSSDESSTPPYDQETDLSYIAYKLWKSISLLSDNLVLISQNV